MSSEDRATRESHPPLPYTQRFVKGEVVRHDEGIVHFGLLSPPAVIPPPQWARVLEDPLPKDRQVATYPLGSLHRLFLLEPTAKDPTLWHASLAWADPHSNPWDDDSPYRPMPGTEVKGTVTAFVSDFAAIVTLDDSGIDAFLHWENIPAGRHPIASMLQVGDRILALVSGVDRDRLLVWLSVTDAVEQAKRRFQELRLEPGHQDKVVLHRESPPLEAQPFAGLRVLVVEHDPIFAGHLLDLLRGLGAAAMRSDNPRHLMQLLGGDAGFTHILCDYLMGNSAQRRELQDLVTRFKVPVALMSGEYLEAQAAAHERGWAFLPKPISYADLQGWLMCGKVPSLSPEEATPSQAWGLGFETKSYLKRARSAISQFCQRVQAVGAFWVRRQREGVYAILAAYGLDKQRLSQVEERFGQSLVRDVIEMKKPVGSSLDRTGPLRETAPQGTDIIVGLPLRWIPEMLPDALIVYVKHPHRVHLAEQQIAALIEPWQAYLENLQVRLGDLDEMALLAERLREAEAFATMGRVAGAILHEIRQALQAFDTYAPLARSLLKRQAPSAEVLDAVNRLAESAQRVAGLSKTNLYNLQKTRRQAVQIHQCIPEILGWYEPRAQRQDLLLRYELLGTPVTLALPPEAVEQPLANLLDKAFHHFGERKWGSITVRLRFDPSMPTQPVSIEVSDQGLGMTAEQRVSLFTPRVSAKGTQGYGLGLYTSRQLLQAVGGDLECVESLRWLGSTFRMRLPFNVDRGKA